MRDADDQRPLTILIAALGGEGGGVLMNWIVEAAQRANLPVQATSVPGVAQRTGSTSYYIEMLRHRPPEGTPDPVFALVPMPARVDCVVASELVEAARMLERGFVSPTRTTLIASTSRVLTTAEKIPMGDGRYDAARIEAAARALARTLLLVDLEAIAREHRTMISAAMFGALASSGVLPFSRADCEAVIGDGSGARASRAGFAAAFDAAHRMGGSAVEPASRAHAGEASVTAAAAQSYAADDQGLPPAVLDVISLGHARARDYQDDAYATLYLDRVRRLADTTAARDPITVHALEEAARRLALWMTYEDIPRVADLKTRPERFAGIRRDAEMAPDQILVVEDFLKPGAEEVAAMLPAAWGRRIMARVAMGRAIPGLGFGLNVRSNGVFGYAILRLLARFKAGRRGSLRFGEEQARIETWLAAMQRALPRSPAFADALAALPRVLKGYGETQARGQRSYVRIMTELVEPAIAAGGEAQSAKRLREAVAAALADPDARALTAVLAQSDAETRGTVQ
jgi:indolepyruvate ferredoxin oxidoreductase beta subunit